MWKIIDGMGGKIEISSKGQVRSNLTKTPRILKAQVDSKGYLRIRVTINGIKKTIHVHRAVAKAFIPNPDELPQVNHKDGNKDNNATENLEWVTNIENAHHAIENGLWDSVFEATRKENESRKKPIIAYRIDGDSHCTRYYESISEAERDIGSRHICDVLKRKRSHVKGWTFEYAKEVMHNADIDYRTAE
jgi:hypothetical protein